MGITYTYLSTNYCLLVKSSVAIEHLLAKSSVTTEHLLVK
jgi:hypothetical protein